LVIFDEEAGIGGNMEGWDRFGGVLLYSFGALFLIWVLRVFARNEIDRKKNLDRLIASGFKINHFLDGTVGVAFNDSSKKVAFISSNGCRIYGYHQIATWQWKWTLRHGAQRDNLIAFQIRDPSCPLLQTRVDSARKAELWIAKIEAILNS
jgi:hypothetical protein